MDRQSLSQSRKLLYDSARNEGYASGLSAAQHSRPDRFSVHLSIRGGGGETNYCAMPHSSSRFDSYSRNSRTGSTEQSISQAKPTSMYGTRKNAEPTNMYGPVKYTEASDTYGSKTRAIDTYKDDCTTKYSSKSKHYEEDHKSLEKNYKLTFADMWGLDVLARLDPEYEAMAWKETMAAMAEAFVINPQVDNFRNIANNARYHAYKRQCRDAGKKLDIQPPPYEEPKLNPDTVWGRGQLKAAEEKLRGESKYQSDSGLKIGTLRASVYGRDDLHSSKTRAAPTASKPQHTGYIFDAHTTHPRKTTTPALPYPASTDASHSHTRPQDVTTRDPYKPSAPTTIDEAKKTTEMPGHTHKTHKSYSDERQGKTCGTNSHGHTWRGEKGAKHPDASDAKYMAEIAKRSRRGRH